MVAPDPKSDNDFWDSDGNEADLMMPTDVEIRDAAKKIILKREAEQLVREIEADRLLNLSGGHGICQGV